MAKSLNKSRIRDSRLLIAAVFLIVFFTRALIDFEAPAHEIIEFVGYFLIAICATGRIYATAFLGGHKNHTLITYGAFSIVRNPLYFFSLLGMTGIAFISGHVLLIFAIPLSFGVMYHFLIKREEAFLAQEFGQPYAEYCARTPRLFPNFALYNAPETVDMSPKFLKKAYMDAVWWFAVFPLFELSEVVIDRGWIKPLVMVP